MAATKYVSLESGLNSTQRRPFPSAQFPTESIATTTATPARVVQADTKVFVSGRRFQLQDFAADRRRRRRLKSAARMFILREKNWREKTGGKMPKITYKVTVQQIRLY